MVVTTGIPARLTDRDGMATRRPSASIVIPVWNGWELTRACLETLRPTLGVRDEARER